MTIDNRQPILVLNSSISPDDPYVGVIRTYGFNFEQGFDTDGGVQSIAAHTYLFSFMGTSYGGDGRTTFGMPDFEGRLMVGAGNGPGLDTVTLGQEFGSNTVALTQANYPSSTFGSDVAVENTQASTGVHYYIATHGLFPSRSALGEGALAEEAFNNGGEPFIGQVIASTTGASNPGGGFVRAEGQLLAISGNEALFSILGTTYGGDGRTTFALPDFRGRVAVGEGRGPGLSEVRLGEKLGREENSLTTANLPSPDGSSQILDNYQPGLGMNFIVSLYGVYPSRDRNHSTSEQIMGEIQMFAGNFAPRGYAFADGQLLAISQNTALFSLFGTTFGGDGRTTFALPDLRGRSIVDDGIGDDGVNYRLGSTFGTEDIQILSSDAPFIPQLSVSFDDAAIVEDGSTTTMTVSRDGPTTDALVVTLASGDTTEATVPNSVTIAAGESAVDVIITSVDDDLRDGDQTVAISASTSSARAGVSSITILDDDGLLLVGDAMDNSLDGSAYSDDISGLAGDDVINSGTGFDAIDGGLGYDTAIMAGNFADYTVAENGDYRDVTITGTGEEDTLIDVEAVQFDDGVLLGGVFFENDEIRFDSADEKPWDVWASKYDGGEIQARARVFDSGAMTVESFTAGEKTSQTTYDVDGNFNYDTIVTTYDANGLISTSTVHYDDGSSKVNMFTDGILNSTATVDTIDDFGYASKTRHFDINGDVTSFVTVYDTGATLTQNYSGGVLTQSTSSDPTDVYNYDTIVTNYEADGDKTTKLTTYDDGQTRMDVYTDDVLVRHTYHDVNDAKGYFARSTGYEADGTTVAYTIRVADDFSYTTTGTVPDGAVDDLLP